MNEQIQEIRSRLADLEAEVRTLRKQRRWEMLAAAVVLVAVGVDPNVLLGLMPS